MNMQREIAYGVRALGRPDGDGDLVGVRGRESRLHGEGGQAGGWSAREVREMRNAETTLAINQEAIPDCTYWRAG